ncbi:MAG: aminopeptidase [Lachnospiraceae bacterium]|nr:aminopeptidase [Lachnospiraceae bacterium]
MATKKAEPTKDKKGTKPSKNAWLKYSEKDKKAVFAFAEEYRKFISDCKTERECVDEVLRQAKAEGYVDLKDAIAKNAKLKAGDKVYVNHMGKAVALFLIGEEPLEKGMKLLGAHIDSPRLDLKQVPFYEDTEMAMLDTHYYGGIKKYQWVTLPLALHGVVVKKDGTVVNVVIGEKETDPVVGITDLLVHLSAKQMEKTAAKVVEGEDLNILVGSIPLEGEEKEAVKSNILAMLKDTYDIEEDDFVSAEIEAVPAGAAREFGIDRSMIMGYGHDDRVCAYPSLKALFALKKVDRTAVCILVDKEEIGSVGATGMHSRFFENAVAEVMNLCGDYSELKVRRALSNSQMLSSDVSAAFDPNYPSVSEKKNTAYFGKGLVFNKYTGSRGKSGSNDANAEYMARLRSALDAHKVTFQTSELGRVDEGGGGTIAYIMANYGMEVIDSGVAVLNMHAPWEIISKSDLYEAYCGYVAFLKEI